MDPITIASGISAASSLLSGAFGASSARSADKQSMEVVTHGIRHRVHDAKQAGLHPLYALGANITSPQFSTGNAAGEGIAAAGQAIARGVRDKPQAKRQIVQDNQTRQLHQLQMIESAARSRKDFAQANLFNSEVKRGQQASNYRQDLAQLLKLGGINLPGHTGSRAQEAEDSYGNILGEVFGLVNAAETAGKLVYDKSKPKSTKYRSPVKRAHDKRMKSRPPRKPTTNAWPAYR